MLTWIEALKVYNSGRDAFCIPKRGTLEHAGVISIMRGDTAKAISQKDQSRIDQFNAFEKRTKMRDLHTRIKEFTRN